MGKDTKYYLDRFVYLLLAGMVALSLLLVGITSSGGIASRDSGGELIAPPIPDGNGGTAGMDGISNPDEGNFVQAAAPAIGGGGAVSHSSRTEGGASALLPSPATPAPLTLSDIPVTVMLIDSVGAGIAGAEVEYEQGGWIAFGVTDANGTARRSLEPGIYSFRVVYEDCVCSTSHNITENPGVLFQTDNATVLLKTAEGAGLAGGTVEFFNGNWTGFGTTGHDGSTSREMLPGTYPVRVHYEGAVLETILTTSVPLECTTTSVTLHFPGTIRFNAGGWRAFTQPSMELLPGTYACTFDGYETNISVNNSAVEKSIFILLLEGQAAPGLSGGTGQYSLSGTWHTLPGNTNTSGVLVGAPDGSPGRLNVRMTYANATLQKRQDIRTNPVFRFATTTVTVRSADSEGRGIGNDDVLYAADGWHTFGTTGADGNTTLELLPKTYTFRLISNGTTRNQVQDIGIDPLVIFTTNTTTVRFADSAGNGIAGGVVEYYASGWKTFGTTGPDGNVTKELLPKSYTFRITSDGATLSKVQDIAADPVVEFGTNLTTVRFETPDGTGIAGATVEYNAGGWKPFGTTGADGNATKELLPMSYTFRITCDGATISKVQDVAANPVVEFRTNLTTVRFETPDGIGIPDAAVEYKAGGWKPFGTTG
ncbi:MAG: hypothetical protein JXA08_08630, partial [Methanomicrobiaceae archaeon]|nr:hypothetical protein [Methanomicrobiaceae archaeon]